MEVLIVLLIVIVMMYCVFRLWTLDVDIDRNKRSEERRNAMRKDEEQIMHNNLWELRDEIEVKHGQKNIDHLERQNFACF